MPCLSWLHIAAIPGPGLSDTETMAMRVTTMTLVIQVTWAQSGYWWMGQSGLFGGSENLESSGTGGYAGVSSADNVVENVEAIQTPEKLQLQQPQDTPSYAGYGNSYYGNQASESQENENQQAQASVISNDINERNSNYGGEFTDISS